MGTWQMEVCRFALYLAFPVTLFHIFNQPAYFEDWVIRKKREMYPPENKEHTEMYQSTVQEMRKKNADEFKAALESYKKNVA